MKLIKMSIFILIGCYGNFIVSSENEMRTQKFNIKVAYLNESESTDRFVNSPGKRDRSVLPILDEQEFGIQVAALQLKRDNYKAAKYMKGSFIRKLLERDQDRNHARDNTLQPAVASSWWDCGCYSSSAVRVIPE